MQDKNEVKYVSFKEFRENCDFFIKEAKLNKVFIYPTDTIYGIGTIFTQKNLENINTIKRRPASKMCSIIAPDMTWIKNNHKLPIKEKEIQKLLEKYHGTTFIFDHKKPGVRLIKHDFQKFVTKLGLPFITTSVNITKGDNVNSVNQIPDEIKKYVDYIIDDGDHSGKASVLVDFVDDTVLER